MAKVNSGVGRDPGGRNPVPFISAKRQRIQPLPERLDSLPGTEHCCFLGADYGAVYLDSDVRNSAFQDVTIGRIAQITRFYEQRNPGPDGGPHGPRANAA